VILVSCPISNIAFVAIKMGCRSGSCRTKAMLFMGQDTSDSTEFAEVKASRGRGIARD
jgi:hypothetical protein